MDSMLSGGDGLVSKMCPALVTPWTVAYKAPLSMGFPRQEYWSGLPSGLSIENNPLQFGQLLYFMFLV